jgi:DNA-binding CsgD family transcriptional regulator
LGQTKLWEREPVLAAFSQTLEDAREGRGNATFVVGEAGLGKTAVLEHALNDAAASGMAVGFGRGEVMEQAVAFGLAAQVATGLGGADLMDRLGLGDGAIAEPSVPYHRMLRWLEARDGMPLLLAFDDFHWADADSMSFVAFLARRLNDLPVALIATLRPWPHPALRLAREEADAGVAGLKHLAPLSRAAADELIADRAGADVPAATADRAFALCRGNPLLTEQLALILSGGGGVPESKGEGPQLAEGLLLQRFAGLEPAGLAYARAGSVLGATFRPELASEIAGLPEEAIDGAVEALFQSGLLADADPPQARFVHPLFAQALYDDMAAPVRRRLHARAMRTLIAQGQDAAASEHAVRAELQGDRAAIGALARAGEAALASGAVATAAKNLEAAVAFSGDRVPADLLLSLCLALTACGRAVDAAEVCERLLAYPGLGWRDRVEALRMHGRALYLSGSPDHGERVLEKAAALAVGEDPGLAAQSLVDLSLSVWAADGPGRALPIAARARALARGAEPERRRLADATWGHIALETGDPEGLAATDPVGVELAGEDGARLLEPAELTWPWAVPYQYAMNCNYADRHEEAERVFRRARRVVEDAGAANALAVLAIYIANSAIRSGRLEAALEEAVRAQEFAELTPGALPYALIEHAEVLAWMGRLDESETFCGQAEELGAGQWFVSLWLAHVRGLRLLWAGDRSASDQLLRAEAITREAGIREPCHLHWWGHAVTAHLAVGREDDAVRVLEWLEECARPLCCRWPRITAAVGRAELEARAGNDEAADTRFGEALELHGLVDFPLDRAEALLAYGGFLRRRGRPVDARPPLADALRIAERTGAGWLRDTAGQELRLAGGRRRRQDDDRDELTAAERRVANLAAGGHTNAEIARHLHLSVNTVATHLKHVFVKLGITSRRQLTTDNAER